MYFDVRCLNRPTKSGLLFDVERLGEILLTAARLVAITATLLPIIRHDAWWIRIFDFPRAQIAIVGALTLAADLIFRTESGMMINALRLMLTFSLAYQGYMIYPYTFFARKQVQAAQKPEKERKLSLLLANVRMHNRNAAALRQIIRQADPDVVLAVETDEWWQSELREFERTRPFVVHRPQDNTYGMILYSRLELIDSEVRCLFEDDVPSIRTTLRLPLGTRVRLYCLHPKPPVPQEHPRSTERDAELVVVGRESKREQMPVIVLGDLNDVGWSRTSFLFQKISGLVDPRIGRGLYNSFHASYPFMRCPLDHFFHSTHFRLIELRRLAHFGSDHFPMYIALSYEPDAEQEQKAPEADAADEAEATEKIKAPDSVRHP